MGIGNIPKRLLPGLGFRLITPHGDREPLSVAGSPASRNSSSLPLMGIGNNIGPGTTSSSSPSHYPSWGSGTVARKVGQARRAEAHYPSWGSGTLTIRPRPDSGEQAHYPSWGSGTSHHRARKGVVMTSLPLMGIGNDGEEPPGEDQTPTSHYPSWGSGTSATELSLHAVIPLITPHGDRERPGPDHQ